MNFQQITLALATLTTGLMAGIFFAFSNSVMPGLGKLPDVHILGGMQSINRVIQNPLFFLCFFVPVLLMPLAGYLHYSKPVSPAFMFIMAAFLVYLLGGFILTIAGNVPLNNALDAFNIEGASIEEMSRQRAAYESRWLMLNHIRAVACTIATLLLIATCFKTKA